jgi:hypothetical protein
LKEDDEPERYQYPSGSLGGLANALAETRPERKPDLSCDECLHREKRDRPGDGKGEKPDAEADRECVEANWDAEREQR